MGQRDYFSNSPFREYLGTNQALSDRDAIQLAQTLREPAKEVEIIEAEIANLGARLAHLKKGIHEHLALTHPIRRVPNELLQHIFIYTIPTKHFPTTSFSDAPLALTRVCRAWRSVALNTPQLWSSIHIVSLPEAESSFKEVTAYTTRLDSWFQAARGLPLSISLFSALDYTAHRDVDKEFVNTILAQSTRVRVLELQVSQHLFELVAQHQSEWPILERVAVDMDRTAITQEPPWLDGIADPEVTLWAAPNLKTIDWRSVDESIFAVHPHFRWRQMEEIALSSADPELTTGIGFAPSVLRTLLREASHIGKLRMTVTAEEDEHPWETLECLYWEDDVLPPAQPVRAPLVARYLTTLELIDTFVCPSLGKAVTPFLYNLHLPALTSLNYTLRLSDRDSQPDSPPPLVANHPLFLFLGAQRQPTAITQWTVTLTSICYATFVECLRLMPSLEQLHVRDDGKFVERVQDEVFQLPSTEWHMIPDDHLLDTLLRPQSGVEFTLTSIQDTILCPRLHSIRFDVGDFSMEALHVFLEIRVGLSLLLQRLRPSSKKTIALLRLFHIRSITMHPNSLCTDMFDPVVNEKALRCHYNEGCTCTEDCEENGVRVRFDVIREDDKKKFGKMSERIRTGRKSRLEFNPRAGLPVDSSDEESEDEEDTDIL
jgi:hypothetical protein